MGFQERSEGCTTQGVLEESEDTGSQYLCWPGTSIVRWMFMSICPHLSFLLAAFPLHHHRSILRCWTQPLQELSLHNSLNDQSRAQVELTSLSPSSHISAFSARATHLCRGYSPICPFVLVFPAFNPVYSILMNCDRCDLVLPIICNTRARSVQLDSNIRRAQLLSY